MIKGSDARLNGREMSNILSVTLDLARFGFSGSSTLLQNDAQQPHNLNRERIKVSFDTVREFKEYMADVFGLTEEGMAIT